MQLSIFILEFSFCFVWLQTRMLNQFKHISSSTKQSLISIPFIKHFISLNRLTLHCALRCVLCSVFTVQLGALYGLHWCAVYAYRVQWFLLRYHCKFLISVEDISSPNYFPPCRIFLHSHRLRFPSLSTNLKSHPKCQTECYLTLHYVQFQKNAHFLIHPLFHPSTHI